MRAQIGNHHHWARAAVALIGVGALAGTIACGGTQAASSSSQAAAGGMSVNCGAGQQAIIRPSVVNGQPISQVDCVPGSPASPVAVPPQPVAGQPMPLAPLPLATVPAAMQGPAAAMVPVSYQPSGAVVANDVVEYHPRVIKRTRVYAQRPARSVKKSAIIIGSSAGIGAAIGGAIKGGKGALIGAALGGGGAAIWDQATRRR